MTCIDNRVIIELSRFRKSRFFKPDSKIRVYLCGPIEFKKDLGKTWREIIEKRLVSAGFSCFNPKPYPFRKHFDFHSYKVLSRKIIYTDLYEVLRSDIILVNWENKIYSPGSSSEVTVAGLFGIPVLFVTKDIEGTPKWIVGNITTYRKNFNNIENIINKMVKRS